MPSKEDSTETFRKKVSNIAEETAMTVIEKHMAENNAMHKENLARNKELKEFQETTNEIIRGAYPPDATKPGMWQPLQDMILWKKGVNKVLWVACTTSVAALVGVIWKLLLSGAAQ